MWGRLTGKSLVGVSLLVLIMGLVAAACGGEDEAAAPAPAAPAAPAATAAALAATTEEPKEPAAAAPAIAAPTVAAAGVALIFGERGTFRHAHNCQWGGAENMDPASPARFQEPIQWVMDRLLGLDLGGVPSPILAQSWTVNPIATQWTFNLEQGVEFHDGTPMTSQDVVYSIQHHLDPDVGSQLASVLDFIDPDGFETPDDHTVVINLLKGHADLPLLMTHYAMRVIPVGSRDTIGDTGMGTGPFIPVNVDVDGVSRFISNDSYWRGLPGVYQYTEVGICDGDARVQAILADQIDLTWSMTVAQGQLFEGDDDFVVQENGTGSIQNIAMIVTEPPYDDLRVRKALKLLVDPDEMIAVITQGHATKACNNPVRPFDQYYLPTECPQDIEQARSLLAEAGYGNGLTIEFAASQLSPQWLPLATVYKDQAGDAGVTVEIKQVPADGYWANTWMVHPFSNSNWGMRHADQFMNEAFRCGASWGEYFWCNVEFDSLLDQARAEVDFDQRKGLYQHAQELLIEESGMIAPFFQNDIRALTSRVQGIDERVIFFEYPWHSITLIEQ